MTVIFRDETAKKAMSAAYDRFHERLAPFAETTSRTVTTRFGETHVLVAGRADAPPLVLLHGALATSAHVMREVVPLLDRFRVYAPDVLGQSVKSADTRVPVDGPAYGEWLLDVLDGLAVERPSVYGVSWGGMVARRLVEIAPDRVDRLILLVPAGIVAGSAWKGLTELAIPMALYRTFPSEARLRRFAANLFSTLDDEWISYFGEAVRSYRLDMRVPPLAEPEAVAGFTRPTLVIGAGGDVSFPGAPLVARAKELFPHAEVELLEGSRHSPPTDDVSRAKLCERVARFLGDQPRPDGGGS